MNQLQRIIANRIVKPWLKWRLKRPSAFHYKNLNLDIFPGVFHPRYFFSSCYLADFVDRLDLKGLSFAEPCTGSALISLIARTKGANVICSDIDSRAVRNAQHNYIKNESLFPTTGSWTLLESDLFKHYPRKSFDFIVVNPPYFFQAQNNTAQLAWNCGENGEFFEQFFSQLPNHCHANTAIYMILAENCEIDRIRSIGQKTGIRLQLIEERKIRWEKNYIFKLMIN